VNKRQVANIIFLLLWMGEVVGLILSFDLITNTYNRLLLLLIAVFAAIGLWCRRFFPALFLGFFCWLLIVSYWASIGAIGVFVAVILAFSVTLLVGLASYGFVCRFHLTDSLSWEDWVLLAFITAQATALIFYLPILFFEKTLLASLIFYGFWYWLEEAADDSRAKKWAHFVYLGGLAILILGEVIWANLPQLRIF